MIAGEWGDLDAIHGELGTAAARISLRAIARAELTDGCGCGAFRMARPGRYAVAAQAGSAPATGVSDCGDG
ncbi:MAG: hypothetical protein HY660_12705 [Armatimonadetes bacterium]|nr:hypothetical protein [Armatimonadota bacterium]